MNTENDDLAQPLNPIARHWVTMRGSVTIPIGFEKLSQDFSYSGPLLGISGHTSASAEHNYLYFFTASYTLLSRRDGNGDGSGIALEFGLAYYPKIAPMILSLGYRGQNYEFENPHDEHRFYGPSLGIGYSCNTARRFF